MQTLKPGQEFPQITLPTLSGKTISTANTTTTDHWKLVVVYRGKHCPLCTKYLLELNELLPKFDEMKVEVLALSADSFVSAQTHLADLNLSYEVAYDLTIEQMQTLALFISDPQLGTNVAKPFAEPALFVINQQNKVQILDISNAPFARPNLNSIIMGINFIRNRAAQLPINGTFTGNPVAQ